MRLDVDCAYVYASHESTTPQRIQPSKQNQVLNITNPPLGASPTPPHHNLRLLQDSTMPVPFPAAPAGAGTGNGMGRHLQDPNNPWAMPPVISVPPPADAAGQDSGQGSMGPVVKDMELVLKNLRPHTDYLVKVRV